MSLWYSGQSVSEYTPPQELVKYVHAQSKVDADIQFVDIPFVIANEKNVEGFGYFIENYDKTPVQIVQWPSVSHEGKHQAIVGGTSGGITGGTFSATWDPNNHCRVTNEGVLGTYDMGFRKGNNIYFQGSNYHPDGSQLFKSLDQKPFVVALAKKNKDNCITPLHFVAFLFDGRRGFCVPPGVYHQAVFPVKSTAKLQSKQGKIHGVVVIDFLREFGVLARIPNAFSNPALELKDPVSHMHADLLTIQHHLLPVTKTAPSALNGLAHNETGQINGSKIKHIHVHLATNDYMKPYGRLVSTKTDPLNVHIDIVSWPSQGRQVMQGNEAGVITGRFIVDWEHKPNEPSELTWCVPPVVNSGGAFLGFKESSNKGQKDIIILVTEMWSKPDGSWFISPLEPGAYILLLATNNKLTNTPELSSLRALLIPSEHGVLLKPEVWTSRTLPSSDGTGKFMQRCSAVNANRFLNTEEHWGSRMAIEIDIPYNHKFPMTFMPRKMLGGKDSKTV